MKITAFFITSGDSAVKSTVISVGLIYSVNIKICPQRNNKKIKIPLPQQKKKLIYACLCVTLRPEVLHFFSPQRYTLESKIHIKDEFSVNEKKDLKEECNFVSFKMKVCLDVDIGKTCYPFFTAWRKIAF